MFVEPKRREGQSAADWSADRTEAALDRISELEWALKSIVKHWDEFGPASGFDETIEFVRKFVADDAN